MYLSVPYFNDVSRVEKEQKSGFCICNVSAIMLSNSYVDGCVDLIKMILLFDFLQIIFNYQLLKRIQKLC